MAIDLPVLSRQATVELRLIDFGGDLTPILGGPVQRILRLGSRLAADVTLPTMDAACGRAWIAARMRAKAEGHMLRLGLKQLGVAPASRAASSGAGAEIVVASAAGVEVGHLFSFIVAGVSYLHQVTDISGTTLSVAPMLRADPGGQTLNFQSPVIEGLVDGATWSVERLRFIGQRFTLAEAR